MTTSISLHEQKELQSLAENAVKKWTKHARKHLNIDIKTPEVSLNQRGKVAGSANIFKNIIKLNLLLFKHNREAFLHDVICHEMAHLIAYKLHGKVKPHGEEWKRIMKNTFNLIPHTTHSFDISVLNIKRFLYECNCNQFELTIIRHNRVQTGKRTYFCSRCNGPLMYKNDGEIKKLE